MNTSLNKPVPTTHFPNNPLIQVDMWRYFVHADFQARYFWFKHARMLLMLVLLLVPEAVKAPPTASDEDRARVDLTRSLLQVGRATGE